MMGGDISVQSELGKGTAFTFWLPVEVLPEESTPSPVSTTFPVLSPAGGIVLDIMMPGIDGWTVLLQLKSDPQLQAIPVVLATMIENKVDKVEGILEKGETVREDLLGEIRAVASRRK